jgi:hypothetical protein
MAPHAVRCTAWARLNHKGLGLEKGGSTNCREAHHAAKPFAENARTELRASIAQEVAGHPPEIDKAIVTEAGEPDVFGMSRRWSCGSSMIVVPGIEAAKAKASITVGR